MDKFRYFDSELEKLSNRLNQMCELVESQVSDTMGALAKCNIQKAEYVVENDNLVDRLDVKIDKLCQKIFALNQPVASDLRFIMAALKINNDLERIGDHAVNIAKRIEPLADYNNLITDLKLDSITCRVTILLKDITSLVKTRNLTFATDIMREGAAIKEDCKGINDQILDEMMHKNEIITVATNLMIIVNLLERITGYSVNIAESIIFVVDGKIIKHRKKDKYLGNEEIPQDDDENEE